MLLRIVAILLLIGASGAAAQTGLRVQYLGVGSEHDAPGALAGMARTDAAPGLIDDTGGGSWWRAQVAGDGAMDTAAAGLPEVLVFK
ncbi:MAG TPA: hypothetical protein VFN09_06835, partial [Rhodanobacteraceae bacterium]|nr:hypothetical protein [Rhodanobacteraceae bacterium]